MTKFKDFDAEVAEQNQEEIAFKIGGEQFTCITPVPVGALIVVARDMVGTEVHQMAGMMSLLESWTRSEDHVRLRGALARVTDSQKIQDLLEYLVESSTNRPT